MAEQCPRCGDAASVHVLGEAGTKRTAVVESEAEFGAKFIPTQWD